MKKITIICCALFLSLCATAQIDLTSEGQKMVKQAFSNAFVLVRQNYVIADSNHSKYGLGDEDFFGRKVGIGVRTDYGLAMLTSVAQPWKEDASFNQYKDNYKPEVSRTEFKELKDTAFKAMDKPADSFILANNASIAYAPEIICQNALTATLPEPGKVTGWLVLLTSEQPIITNHNSALSIDVYKQTITFEQKKLNYPIESNSSLSSKNIIGGIFVVPEYETGKIIFKYVGLIEKSKEGWILVLTTKDVLQNISANKSTKEEIKEVIGKKLSPIGNNAPTTETNTESKTEDKKQKGKSTDKKEAKGISSKPKTEADTNSHL